MNDEKVKEFSLKNIAYTPLEEGQLYRIYDLQYFVIENVTVYADTIQRYGSTLFLYNLLCTEDEDQYVETARIHNYKRIEINDTKTKFIFIEV
jgi:hypothetical protein